MSFDTGGEPSFFLWSESIRIKIGAAINALRPEGVPELTPDTGESRLDSLTRQQKEDWAEAISRHLYPEAVSRCLGVLRTLIPLPTLTEGQRADVREDMFLLHMAQDKRIRRATDYAGGRIR